jgi:hypothetical protein
VGDRSPWPLEAAIRRYSKPLADLVARDANEGDTRLLVTSIQTFHHWLRAQRVELASRHAKVRRKGIGGAKRVDHGRLRALPVTSLVSDTRAGVGNRPHRIGGQPDVCAAGLRNAGKNRTEETSMASSEQKRPGPRAATETMPAAVVEDFARPLVVKQVAKPVAGQGEIVVRVETSGLCHTDIHAAHGDWPVKPSPPFIPGHEGIGTVEEVGSGVTEVVVGDRVAMPWLGYACGTCDDWVSSCWCAG